MYIRVRKVGNHWFRDDDGTIVGETARAYANIYFGGKTPIIKTKDGIYIKPHYGRIDSKTKNFLPLCEGRLLDICIGKSCSEHSSSMCPRFKTHKSDGYYIFIN